MDQLFPEREDLQGRFGPATEIVGLYPVETEALNELRDRVVTYLRAVAVSELLIDKDAGLVLLYVNGSWDLDNLDDQAAPKLPVSYSPTGLRVENVIAPNYL